VFTSTSVIFGVERKVVFIAFETKSGCKIIFLFCFFNEITIFEADEGCTWLVLKKWLSNFATRSRCWRRSVLNLRNSSNCHIHRLSLSSIIKVGLHSLIHVRHPNIKVTLHSSLSEIWFRDVQLTTPGVQHEIFSVKRFSKIRSSLLILHQIVKKLIRRRTWRVASYLFVELQASFVRDYVSCFYL
jgi:hypothetical protein